MDSVLDSTLTAASRAMLSRVLADPAPQLTLRLRSPRSTAQKTSCHGSLRKMVPSARHVLSKIPTAPTTAAYTTYSSSPAAATPGDATSLNRTSYLLETR